MSDIALSFARDSLGERTSVIAASPVATVEAWTDPRAIEAEWRSLAAASPSTPYQAPDWLIPWIETVGLALGIEPLIVVARDGAGSPVALLPFGVTRQGGLSVAAFLGAKDANFHMGLFRRDVVWTGAALADLLRRAARAGRRRVDLFALHNQPLAWDGIANPLAMLASQPSPSFAYKATLGADAEAFFAARLSRESRKKARQKMTRLQGLGAVEVVRADGEGEVAEVLDALLRQRRERCEALGLPVDDAASQRAFLGRVAAPGPQRTVELHALRCGERIVATFAGARSGSHVSGMMMSFSADPDVARASPGELLLAEVMRRACREGIAVFDLGVGEARYKESYCPDVEPLFDSVVPVSWRGTLAAAAESLRLRLKRKVKQSAWAWPLVRRVRKLMAGRPDVA